MSDLFCDVYEQGREIARLQAELGEMAAQLARLAVEIKDLKASWPQDPAVFVIEDSHQVN